MLRSNSEAPLDKAPSLTGISFDPTAKSARQRLRKWLLIGAILASSSVVVIGAAYYEELRGRPSIVCDACVSLTQHRPTAPPFDFGSLRVPRSEVLSGGPPKDGIPALTSPRVITASGRGAPQDSDRVIGVSLDGHDRAYPLAILNYHEIVNDRLGKTPVAVTYCPLCDSALVFDRRTSLGEKEFGVSGLLYNSNVLMYDRSGGGDDSLWSQLMASGVSGAASDLKLLALPIELTTWGAWLSRHPTSDVLSTDTGHRRDYDRNPYEGYFNSPRLIFPAEPSDDRLSKKVKVLGLWTESAALAVPVSAFPEGVTTARVSVAGKNTLVEYDNKSGTLRVIEADDGVNWMYSLWFAWYAFHPETDLYTFPRSSETR